MHCVANGHTLVALANLHSQATTYADDSFREETDSFMYQTVGSNEAVPMLAECFGLPLFTRKISGQAVEVGMNYVARRGDEVEDLMELLTEVKLPDVEGVATGAILSNYQRLRVENVCSRLGLTSLSYLWQADQSSLLQSMIDCGIQAVLVKVAALGLNPSHLNRTLSEMQSHFESLKQRFGSHICGEGGEYETITLDCPIFKKRLVIANSSTVIHSNDAGAIVAYLRFLELRTEEKDVGAVGMTEELRTKLLSFCARNYISDFDVTALMSMHSKRSQSEKLQLQVLNDRQTWSQRTSISAMDGFVAIGGAYSRVSSSTEDETRQTLDQIGEILENNYMTWTDVVMMHLFVADMNEFSAINSVYGSYFGCDPPTRVTVQAAFSKGDPKIQIDCLAFRNTGTGVVEKTVMHVQSVSYWAPSNIGPYSQTVKLDDQLLVAGQIGLIPNYMSLPTLSTNPVDISQLLAESVICFNNIRAIASVQGCDLSRDLASLVCFVRSEEYLGIARYFCRQKIMVSHFAEIASSLCCGVSTNFSKSEGQQRAPSNPSRVDIHSWNRGSLTTMLGTASLVGSSSVLKDEVVADAILEILHAMCSNDYGVKWLVGRRLALRLYYSKEMPRSIFEVALQRIESKISVSLIPVDALITVSDGREGLLAAHALFTPKPKEMSRSATHSHPGSAGRAASASGTRGHLQQLQQVAKQPAPVPGNSQREAADAYLRKHNIPDTLQQILTALLHQRPDDPRKFIIKKLEEAKNSKARGQSLLVFSRENLVALFKVFDVTGKGHITLDQYKAAMTDIGACNYDSMPVGYEKDRIMMDDFVDNA
ncbi:ATP binding domain 4 [Entophlyctis sp. JEL0112]|nr:ATP binding domain 4 [Entophlyctis sp. JEL0112]